MHWARWGSWERVHVDGRERDVVEDVDAVDLVDLSDAVLEVKRWRVVDAHFELGEAAEDLHLQRDVKVRGHSLSGPSSQKREALLQHLCFRISERVFYLKVMSGHEGEGRQKIPLLLPPAVSQFVIPDQNRFPGLAEAWVDVERDVVTAQEVDREPCGGRNISDTINHISIDVWLEMCPSKE